MLDFKFLHLVLSVHRYHYETFKYEELTTNSRKLLQWFFRFHVKNVPFTFCLNFTTLSLPSFNLPVAL